MGALRVRVIVRVPCGCSTPSPGALLSTSTGEIFIGHASFVMPSIPCLPRLLRLHAPEEHIYDGLQHRVGAEGLRVGLHEHFPGEYVGHQWAEEAAGRRAWIQASQHTRVHLAGEIVRE